MIPSLSSRSTDHSNNYVSQAWTFFYLYIKCIRKKRYILRYLGINSVTRFIFILAPFLFWHALTTLQAYLIQTKEPWLKMKTFFCVHPSWEMQESESKFLTVRRWVLTQGWCGGESLVMGSKKAVKGAETADKIPSHRWQTKAKRGNPASTLHLHFQVKGFT